MAEARNEGVVRPTGDVEAVLNPEKAPRTSGVHFNRAEVVARLNTDGMTVRVLGHAQHSGGRSLSTTIDLDAEEYKALRRALESILEHETETVRDRVVEAAYEAQAISRRRGEIS